RAFIIADCAHPFAFLSRLGTQLGDDRAGVEDARQIDRLKPRCGREEVHMVIVKARPDRSAACVELRPGGGLDFSQRCNPSAANPDRERATVSAPRVTDKEVERSAHAIASAKRAAVPASGTSSNPLRPSASASSARI